MKNVLYAFLAAMIPQITWAACNQTLNPGQNVASAVSAAPGGSTICLNSGNYGEVSISGVVKNPRVTVQSASGQGAHLSFTLRDGTRGINMNSLTVSSADILGSSTKDITVSNSRFTGKVKISDVVNSNILFDHNTHNNIDAGDGLAGRVHLPYGNGESSGVTIQNSEFNGGCADGIQAGVGLNIYHNRFLNIVVGDCQGGPHTDAIQFVFHSGAGPHIKGNYFYNNEQALTAFDRIANAVIEDNVFDAGPIGRPWQIELYSDTNSIIRHNTLLYRADCIYNMTCGQINISRKSADPAGKGTVVIDNIATVISVNNGSSAEVHNNLVRSYPHAGDLTGAPTYVGGAQPATQEGFKLASGSKGVNAASDGKNIGANDFGSGSVTPDPDPDPVDPDPEDPAPEDPDPVDPTPMEGTSLLTNQTPSNTYSDGQNVNYELGLRFKADVAGQITGIRFYKASQESGSHTGKLYSSSGSLLAQVAFSSESASGWQEAKLSNAVSIAANTEYVVSVNTGNTYYVSSNNGFSSPISHGHLTSIAGVFGPVGSMPKSTWQESNYFRDVVFVAGSTTQPPTPAPDTQAPSVPANLKAVAVSTSQINLSYSASSDSVKVAGYRIESCKGSSCSNFSQIASLTTLSYSAKNLSAGTAYRFRVRAVDSSGNLSSFSAIASTSTQSPPPPPVTLLTNQTPRGVFSDGRNVNYELGLRFKASVAGQITGIRFYKASKESGTHIGKLYSSNGTLLAQVTFSSESASGWQEAKLSNAVNIAANTEYVVSVNTGNTYYVSSDDGFSTPISHGHLTSIAGVFGSVGSMPRSTWKKSNYFRDVIFVANP